MSSPLMHPHFGLVDLLLGVDKTKSVSPIAKATIELALVGAFCGLGWFFADVVFALDERRTVEIVGSIALVLLSTRLLLMLFRFLVLRLRARHGADAYEAVAIAIALNAGCWFYLSILIPGLILVYVTNDHRFERLIYVLGGKGAILCISLTVGCATYLWIRRMRQREVGAPIPTGKVQTDQPPI